MSYCFAHPCDLASNEYSLCYPRFLVVCHFPLPGVNGTRFGNWSLVISDSSWGANL